MLRLAHLEEITELLLRLPKLVEQQKQRSADFALNADAWLGVLQGAFSANRLQQAGTVAMLRSEMAAAGQGQLIVGVEFRGRPTRSRVVNAVAAQALQRASLVASALIAENQPRFAEAARISQQVVATALSRRLLNTDFAVGASNTEYLRMVRQGLVPHTDLENAFVHVEGLVGPHDALVFLDRALAAYSRPSKDPLIVRFLGAAAQGK